MTTIYSYCENVEYSSYSVLIMEFHPEKHCQQEVLFAHTDEDVCCVSNICKNTSKEKHLHKICFSNCGIACRLGFCAQVCMSMCNLLTVYLCYVNIISLVKRQKTAEVGPLTFTTFSNIINSG